MTHPANIKLVKIGREIYQQLESRYPDDMVEVPQEHGGKNLKSPAVTPPKSPRLDEGSDKR